jgi:hypothetical protein
VEIKRQSKVLTQTLGARPTGDFEYANHLESKLVRKLDQIRHMVKVSIRNGNGICPLDLVARRVGWIFCNPWIKTKTSPDSN